VADKVLPVPTPETQVFWDSCADHKLTIQYCDQCARHYFYPRPSCPRCGSASVRWVPVSGRATLYSYVISHRAAPGFEAETPYAIAVVQLEEGPRMTTSIVGIENTPENLIIDMPLRVTFQARGGMVLPVFEPAGPGGAL
jgi:uncharacterized OB-fold protein